MLRTRSITLGILGVSLLFGAAGHAVARTQQAGQPVMLMSGLQLANLTRYSATILNPTQMTLGDLKVSVQLPADAVFDHALETPGYTQFAGNDLDTLSWNATSFAPTDAIDAFTFFLAQPSSGTFSVTASWDGGGQIQGQFQPAVQAATDTDMNVTLTTASLAPGLIPVGNTGVFIAGEVGNIPDGTTVHVRVLGSDSNPSSTVGDLWWCSIVEVDGLPSGTGLLLDVPTRQPLAPGAPVSLFTQNGDQWTSLSTEADVTLDGQYISYEHDGGVVAAGTASSFQSLAASGVVVQPGAARLGAIANINNTLAQEGLIVIMTEPGNCQPNCQSTPSCGLGAFNPNLQIPGPTRTCVNKGGGTTTCNLDETNCHGIVQLTAVAGGVPLPANPGHGTACVFPKFDEFLPFTCRQF